MVCDGPDPPDNTPHELNSPPRHDLMMQGAQAEDSDEEQNEVFDYQPLPQGPEAVHSDHENSDNDTEVVSEWEYLRLITLASQCSCSWLAVN